MKAGGGWFCLACKRTAPAEVVQPACPSCGKAMKRVSR